MAKKRNNAGVLARALLSLVVVGVIVGGVTFAVLQSQAAIMRGNTIMTATTGMQVSREDVTYSDTVDGYVFGALIPGGQATPSSGYPVYLKNTSSTKLEPRMSVPGPVTNPGNINLSKVRVIITPASGGAEQSVALADLIASNATGGVPLTGFGKIFGNAKISFTLKVALDADAYSGSGAAIDNFSFNFSGVAVN